MTVRGAACGGPLPAVWWRVRCWRVCQLQLATFTVSAGFNGMFATIVVPRRRSAYRTVKVVEVVPLVPVARIVDPPTPR